ncbi:MAG TPA: bifunctional diaminohydroxyphosphoribosylaminopyrimidine deaminase/5-amino-6-(5-phosphoribosylamino)uracil reductase RibD [Afifellaceae bacterium]|nr:bifunctional diaminohydroxyphosphoribosylaminopyrimidine deaminase/5-amino-6-(5-phosphoribosylamino)uracil reductase RibD [Afifellaceae bacterium]
MPDTLSSADLRHLHAAIRIGAIGLGTTWPNPAVGAVVFNHERIVSSGRTARGGRPHAEKLALDDAGAEARGATLYVSLEPCAHHGRTPPCADAVVAAGIGRVVVGAVDPDPRVSGKGIAKMEAAGIRVSVSPEQNAAISANEGHFRRTGAGRPWVTLKQAVSADGMIGRKGTGQVAITGARASTHVHALRSRYDGILVGRGTVESDDPQLTCRLPGLEDRSPLRIVLDRRGVLPAGAKVFAATGSATVLRFVDEELRESGEGGYGDHVQIFSVPSGKDGLDMAAVLDKLGEFGLTRILVEGGSSVAATVVRLGLADDVLLFRSQEKIGADGIAALAGLDLSVLETGEQFRIAGRRRFGDDVMTRYRKAD